MGNFPASEFFMPTFRNDLSVPSSYPPAYEDGKGRYSETSTHKIQTPGNYPEESIKYSEAWRNFEIKNIFICTARSNVLV